jgi:WD40 repeat protein/serine/threonine protein kinase
MSDNNPIRYCIVCGEPFWARADAEATICPTCSGNSVETLCADSPLQGGRIPIPDGGIPTLLDIGSYRGLRPAQEEVEESPVLPASMPYYCIRCNEPCYSNEPGDLYCENCAVELGLKVSSAAIATEDDAVTPTDDPVARAPVSEPAPVGTDQGPRYFNSDASVPAEWREGDRILDLYEVRDILGRGGMGEVYKVYHNGWKVDLAVKSPKYDVFTEQDGAANFTNEITAWVRLGLHPHIVTCYYVRTLGDLPRVFAEYLEGGSMRQWIADGRLRDLTRMLDVAIQFAWGLHYAHEQGLVHQDVKPHNVMMTPDGVAKVTDFGLAQARWRAGRHVNVAGYIGERLHHTSEDPHHSVLVPGIGMMTPAYCSPEQAEGLPLSHATDIWSWGVSILEMFVGRVTWYRGSGAAGTLNNYLKDGPVDHSIPLMPPDLANLLGRCFAQKPSDRPPSMQQIARELQRIYSNLTGQAYPRITPEPAEARADSLNNWALSMLDLRKVDEAKALWQQALRVDPHHLETVYNRGIVCWQRGEITDEELAKQIGAVGSSTRAGKDPLGDYLLAQAHLERGATDSALPLLRSLAVQSPDDLELQSTLQLAQSEAIKRNRHTHTFRGTLENVNAVCLSADGQVVLSGGEVRSSKDTGTSRPLQLWSISEGRVLRDFADDGADGDVRALTMTHDAALAFSAGRDGTLSLWEVATGQCLSNFRNRHQGEVTSVALGSDQVNGQTVAFVGSKDGTVRLWQPLTKQHLGALLGHEGEVTSIGVSMDLRWAMSGSADRSLRLWDVSTAKCEWVMLGHAEGVTCACLSADSRWALSGSEDGTIRLWNVAARQPQHIFKGHTGAITSVALSANGKWALSAGIDRTVRLWEVATGCCLRTFKGRTVINSVSVSADGRLAVGGGRDGAVRLYELPRKRLNLCTPRLSRLWSHQELSQVESEGAKLLREADAALAEERFEDALHLVQKARELQGSERSPANLRAWVRLSLVCRKVGLRDAWLLGTIGAHSRQVNALSISDDGQLVLSVSQAYRGGHDILRAWQPGQTVPRLFSGPTEHITSVSLLTEGHRMLAVTGADDCTLRIWDAHSGRLINSFQEGDADTTYIAVSANQQRLLSGGGFGPLHLWNLDKGRCERVFQGSALITSVCISADGRVALSGSGNMVRVWDVSTGLCRHILRGHTKPVKSVSLSADGRVALSASEDHTLRIWNLDADDAGNSSILEAHTQSVRSAALSPDGRWALSGGDDKSMRLWDVEAQQQLYTFAAPWQQKAVTTVAFSKDSRFAVMGCADGSVKLWELDWQLVAPNAP